MNNAACGCPDFGRARLTRRRLLGSTAAGAGALMGAQLIGDAFLQVAYGGEPGGNVVVVLSLRGGADGLSMVVPRGVDHDHLVSWRPTIAIPESTLLGADPRFGLHPALGDLMPMWNAGTFGAVHSVGLPAPNRSHFDAMEEVEDADPGSSTRVGWINRLIGLDPSALPQDAVSLGTTLLPTSMIGPASALGAYQLGDLSIADLETTGAVRRASLGTMWAGDQTVLGDGVRLAVQATTLLAPLVDDVDNQVHAAAYPEGPLRDVLANTAALIRADVGTRIVAVDYGDWDMHEGVGRVDDGWMNNHLGHFASSLKAFFADLGSHASRVTVVTISEFGRRLEENGDGGLDHGYGNAMLLLGAGVAGGTVHGAWPGLAEADLEDGDLAMRQDFRSVLWEVMSDRFPAISGDRAQLFPGFTPEDVGVMG
ncbi:DUF1501 domain-containing protein [Nocardioides humilatus]|uniref:DUF1501 domain-containing protein n=1 Tax=Nocardioides humilatus TaxID=2607660 RepID=A0A5B1LL80_9ACTN|nr:DUF1501 domain-containing protein [Nocardioides humilatus]KAA1421525.1 DUF1501 domain-containing protein [Nocardioides humilatus]